MYARAQLIDCFKILLFASGPPNDLDLGGMDFSV